MNLTSKTKIAILTAAMDNAIGLMNDMEKNKGNHFIIEFIFDYEKDSLKTKLIDLTNERQIDEEE